jgi:hypothetical protein
VPAVVLSSSSSSGIFYDNENTVKEQGRVIAKWTVMVFLDGDNSLSAYADDDVAEMEKVGSTTDVELIVVGDDAYNLDLKPGIYHVIYDPAIGVQTPRKPIEEPDMTDQRTLVDYIRWTMQNYPSEKFCLVLWNHGTGWKGMNVDDGTGESYYELELDELEAGLRTLKEEGKKIDVLLFDMCLMGMTEVAYQLQGLADYIVFSENKIPADSRKYDYTLADLKAYPTWSAERLAQEWVIDYVGAGVMITQSAINMSRYSSLITPIRNFANLLCEYVDNYSVQISTASSATKAYAVLTADGIEYLVYADLYDFAYELNNQAVPADLKTACTDIMSAVDYVVLAKKGAADDHGLSIYFPYKNYTLNNAYAPLYMALYDTYTAEKHQEIKINFAHDEGMRWDEFLRAVWFAPPAYTHDITTRIGWGTGYSKNISTAFAPYRAQTNTPISVDVYVRNVGKVNETNVPVVFRIGDPATEIVETKYVSLSKKGVTLVTFNWTTPSSPGNYILNITCELATDENKANDTSLFYIKITDKKILLVDDDGNKGYEKYYTDALDALNIGYEYWNVSALSSALPELWDKTGYGTPSIADTLRQFECVIWFTGDASVRFKGRDIRSQEAYLATGGSLFVADPNLEATPQSSKGLACTYYYKDILHSHYVADDSGATALTGVANDPIGDGLSITISTGDAVVQTEPSVLEPRNNTQIGPVTANWTKASAQRVFTWNTGTYAGRGGVIRVENETYRAIYFGFGFEGINGATTRATIMNRTVNWLLGYKKPFTRALEKGWNLITIPVNVSHTAESLAQNISYCTHVARWDSTIGNFETYVKGSGTGNFALEKGIGYMVYVTADSTLELKGDALSTVSVALQKGWNAIGWFKSSSITAEELALQIGNCTAVSYWDSSSNRFVVHPIGSDINNFDIVKGNGYLAHLTQTTLWSN